MYQKFLSIINENLSKYDEDRKKHIKSIILKDVIDTHIFDSYYDYYDAECYNEYNQTDSIKNKNETDREKKIKEWQNYYSGEKNPFYEEIIAQQASKINAEESLSYSEIDCFGNTHLHNAIIKKDLEKIEKLLKDNHCVNVKNNSGFLPVYMALLLNDNSIIELFKKYKHL